MGTFQLLSGTPNKVIKKPFSHCCMDTGDISAITAPNDIKIANSMEIQEYLAIVKHSRTNG